MTSLAVNEINEITNISNQICPLSENEVKETTNLITQISSVISNATGSLNGLMEKVKQKDMETEKGISLLELKNHCQLSYLSNLTYLILRKLNGLSIENDPSVGILVELRVMLEKMRPIEDKLKYQIDKCIKAPSSSSTSIGENSLNIKGNLDNIECSSEDEKEEVSKKDSFQVDKDDGTKLYKIPRISQTHYPGDEEEKPDKRKEREKKRMLNSAMLQDALSEHVEDPEVVMQTSNVLKQKAVEKRKRIQSYEENHFTRLTLTKKEKHALKAVTTPGLLAGELLSFRDVGGMDGSSHGGDRKRKRGDSKKTKGKKGFKKRRK